MRLADSHQLKGLLVKLKQWQLLRWNGLLHAAHCMSLISPHNYIYTSAAFVQELEFFQAVGPDFLIKKATFIKALLVYYW